MGGGSSRGATAGGALLTPGQAEHPCRVQRFQGFRFKTQMCLRFWVFVFVKTLKTLGFRFQNPKTQTPGQAEHPCRAPAAPHRVPFERDGQKRAPINARHAEEAAMWVVNRRGRVGGLKGKGVLGKVKGKR